MITKCSTGLEHQPQNGITCEVVDLAIPMPVMHTNDDRTSFSFACAVDSGVMFGSFVAVVPVEMLRREVEDGLHHPRTELCEEQFGKELVGLEVDEAVRPD